MTAEIEGKQYPLSEVFGGDFAYRIPVYQRPYAWTRENADELFEDILNALGETDTSPDELDPYFLGSVVLIKQHGTSTSDVVDGQQRLTTLSILLSALRETLQSGADDLTPFLYVSGNQFKKTEAQYRLTLRERDADFFKKHVQVQASLSKLRDLDAIHLDEPQQRIRENALYFLDRLAKLPETERQRFAGYLMRRCYLIVVSTPNHGAAFRIFSVLNDRGLDLSFTDILKSDVIGALPNAKQEAWAERWEEMEVELGREDFEALFAHIRTIYVKDKPRRTILEEFRENVRPVEAPEAFLEKTLTPLAEAFAVIKERAYESTSCADDVNRWLTRLARVDNIDWIPPAMQYLWKRKPPAELLVRFLMELERQAALMMIWRASVNERYARWALVMRETEAGREPFRDESPVFAGNVAECAKVLERLNGNIYDEKKTRVFILTRLDEELSDVGATYDHNVITVEHVLPQTPPDRSQWMDWFPNPADRAHWVGRLANLVLLGRRKNSEAQNFEFEVKKAKYFNSPKTKVAPFALTTEVLKEVEWTMPVLEARQKRLLGVLRKAWLL